MTLNPNHGYDESERSIKKRIDAWQKSQEYGKNIEELLKANSEKFFANEKAHQKWQTKKDDDVKHVNRAREKMISGLVQFLDGLGELKETSGTWLCDPDYLNLLFMTAFSKSTFYEKTQHWAKAEEHFQKERNTSLPGGYSGNGEEKIMRSHDTQWFSIQFLYRQLEFVRFVPNYDIVAGIWALENSNINNCSKLLDSWFYINRENIKSNTDLTDFTRGYFFRYNSQMTSESQAQILYILTNLFRYSMSKPIGTLEYPPWFCDSTITGNADGDLPYSKNIIPHKINLVDIERLNTAPIITNSNGMLSMQNEADNATDNKLASKIVNGKKKSLEQVEKEIDENEEKRPGANKWDGEKILEFDEGRIWVVDGVVTKIRTDEGKVEKLKLADGSRYKVGYGLPE